jgi:cytochrome c oxidase cbb3-type subunit 4
MDNGTLFGVLTAVLLVLFVGGWLWIWRPGCRAVFDAAARMPLEDGEDAMQEDRR